VYIVFIVQRLSVLFINFDHSFIYINVCNAPFTWDRDEVKPEWKLKLSTCLHETGMKITKFQFIPLDRKFSFSDGFCFNSMCCSNVKVTAETCLKCICVYIHPGLNSCRSEFMPVWSHASLKSVGSVQQAEWLETSPSYFRPRLM
jgi:hypothetical protein